MKNLIILIIILFFAIPAFCQDSLFDNLQRQQNEQRIKAEQRKHDYETRRMHEEAIRSDRERRRAERRQEQADRNRDRKQR